MSFSTMYESAHIGPIIYLCIEGMKSETKHCKDPNFQIKLEQDNIMHQLVQNGFLVYDQTTVQKKHKLIHDHR